MTCLTRTILLAGAAAVISAAAGAAQQPSSVPDTTGTLAEGSARPDARLPFAQFKVLLQLDYVSGEPLPQPPNQGFGIRRSRLFAQLNGPAGLGFRLQLEPSVLANGPVAAPPLRGAPLFEAYVDYALPGQTMIRVGQQRVPFGLNSYQGPPSSPMIEFPQFTRYAIQRVDAFRDIGITAGGHTGALEYAAGVFNGAGVNVVADNDSSRDVAGRIAYAILPGVQIGLSGWRGHTGNLFARTAGAAPIKAWYDNADFRRWDGELRVARGPLDVLAEYAAEHLDYNLHAQNPTPDQKALDRAGYNLTGALRLGVFSPSLRRFQLAGRYDRWDPNRDVAHDWIAEYSAGVNFYFLSQSGAAQSRFGRALNDVERVSRVMVFWELSRPQTPGTSPTAGAPALANGQRFHVRWDLYY